MNACWLYESTRRQVRGRTDKTLFVAGDRPLCALAVFDMPNQKTIVIGISQGLTRTDFPPTELQATDLIQLAAGLEALVLGHVLIFTIAAR